jgi:hypothetical protein
MRRVRREPYHCLAIVASCEGEAIILSNWVQKHRNDLESLIGASIVTLTWLASDIAPIGYFICGKLNAIAIEAER